MKIKFETLRSPFPSPRPKFTTFRGYPRAYMPKAYEIEKSVISDLFINDFGSEFFTYDGDLKVDIKFCLPFPKTKFMGFNGKKGDIAKELMATESHCQKPDLDNLVKTYLDALNGVAWKDDSQISELNIKKTWSFTPNVIIEIDYKDIKTRKELLTFNDVKNIKFNEMVDNIWQKRKAK